MVTWLETVYSWIDKYGRKGRKREELLDEIHNLSKEASFEQLKSETANLKAQVIRISARGEEEAALHQDHVARQAAARRARLEMEVDVLRREYASWE